VTTRIEHRKSAVEFFNAANGKNADWTPKWGLRVAILALTQAVLALSADDSEEP
jgi:hypothetical protein